MKVEEFLKGKIAKGYFILDSHQDAMKERIHTDSAYVSYNYNIHHYNKLVEGSFFLYRRPKKSSIKRKFYIYGGGYIESISKPDESGFVDAKITLGFKLLTPVYEDDAILQNVNWETKTKKDGTWSNFWNQYGMNNISENEFWEIVKGQECVPATNVDNGKINIRDLEEEETDINSISVDGFNVVYDNDDFREKTTKIVKTKRKVIGTHIDYDKLNRKKKNIGTAGELLVLNEEIEFLKGRNLPYEVEYVADTQGDGLGYDIKSYNELGQEVHIEVKTTKSGKIDGFYISPAELRESKNPNYIYKIYRVYNFDEKSKTANIKIFSGPIDTNDFKLEAVAYKVTLK